MFLSTLDVFLDFSTKVFYILRQEFILMFWSSIPFKITLKTYKIVFQTEKNKFKDFFLLLRLEYPINYLKDSETASAAENCSSILKENPRVSGPPILKNNVSTTLKSAKHNSLQSHRHPNKQTRNSNQREIQKLCKKQFRKPQNAIPNDTKLFQTRDSSFHETRLNFSFAWKPHKSEKFPI